MSILPRHSPRQRPRKKVFVIASVFKLVGRYLQRSQVKRQKGHSGRQSELSLGPYLNLSEQSLRWRLSKSPTLIKVLMICSYWNLVCVAKGFRILCITVFYLYWLSLNLNSHVLDLSSSRFISNSKADLHNFIYRILSFTRLACQWQHVVFFDPWPLNERPYKSLTNICVERRLAHPVSISSRTFQAPQTTKF